MTTKPKNEIEEMILVIVRKPGEPPYPWFLPSGGEELDALQALVGGNFDMLPGDGVGLPEGVDIWFDEEGKIKEKPVSVVLYFHGSKEVGDCIAGTAIFKAADAEGAPRSLTDDEVVKVTEWLSERMAW